MNITEDDIKLIIKLISERLGPNASPEKIKSLAAEAIGQLSIISEEKPDIPNIAEAAREKPRKLILNALGLIQGDIEGALRSFLLSKNLPLVAFSAINIERYKSVIAIVDYSRYESDINRLKFELSELCEKFGFKAIV